MRSIPFHTGPQAPIEESRIVRTTRDTLVCVASTRGRSTTTITTINREGWKTRDKVCFHRRYDFFRALSCDSSTNLEEMDSSSGRERRRRSGMGMDQESMCVWTLRTSPSAVVGFNPHSSFPSSFSSLLTWSIPELQIPPCPISTPPTHIQLCTPPPHFWIVTKRNNPIFKWVQSKFFFSHLIPLV